MLLISLGLSKIEHMSLHASDGRVQSLLAITHSPSQNSGRDLVRPLYHNASSTLAIGVPDRIVLSGRNWTRVHYPQKAARTCKKLGLLNIAIAYASQIPLIPFSVHVQLDSLPPFLGASTTNLEVACVARPHSRSLSQARDFEGASSISPNHVSSCEHP